MKLRRLFLLQNIRAQPAELFAENQLLTGSHAHGFVFVEASRIITAEDRYPASVYGSIDRLLVLKLGIPKEVAKRRGGAQYHPPEGVFGTVRRSFVLHIPQPGKEDQIAFGDLGFDLDQDAALPVMHLFIKHLLGEQNGRSSK
jgi:hypothetical protein